jgi:hypothetical protein
MGAKVEKRIPEIILLFRLTIKIKGFVELKNSYSRISWCDS